VAVRIPAPLVLDFHATYQQYFRFVWASARRLGTSEPDLDDVVQEVFLVIHAKLHTVQSPDSLRSWIYGVVRRTVSGHRRTHKARSERTGALDDSLVAAKGPTPLDLSEQNAKRALLEELLSRLSEPKREVFILAELEEMSAPEIAAALEIPLNTAYSRLRHARADFEAALARHQKQAAKGRLA
jgi:RNA polymerase sigma-70 factor, ECF subfamily